ncbi:MAG TPA: molybdopterin cofactor-binding domain-containing protein, partial [Rhodopila sp.]
MGVVEPKQAPWIGRRLPRFDARRLLAGRGRYVDDIPARGELQAAFLRSPYPNATFHVADREQAARTPGVAAVFVAADLAPVCREWVCPSLAFPGLVSPPQRALADGRAAYQGEPVAMALAASRAQAEDALDRMVVEWQELPAMTDLPRALAPDAPRAHPDLASNLCWGTELGGDVQACFANAPLVVEDRLDFARVTGVTLEPRGLVASWDPAAEALELRISHQMPHQLQIHLAELLNIRLSRVRVICGDVGGGFGVKMHVYQDEIATCAASRLLGRPVRFIADRMESMMADIHAREHVVRARMAVDAEGLILGFEIDDLQGLGAYSVYPRSSTREAMSALQAIGAPYRFQHFHARLRCALQNKAPTGQLRAVGHPIGCAVTERLIERAARARGEDPLVFRRRNLLPAEEQPWTSPVGGTLFGLSHHACLDRLATLMDLPRLRADIAGWRDAGRCVGL